MLGPFDYVTFFYNKSPNPLINNIIMHKHDIQQRTTLCNSQTNNLVRHLQPPSTHDPNLHIYTTNTFLSSKSLLNLLQRGPPSYHIKKTCFSIAKQLSKYLCQIHPLQKNVRIPAVLIRWFFKPPLFTVHSGSFLNTGINCILRQFNTPLSTIFSLTIYIVQYVGLNRRYVQLFDFRLAHYFLDWRTNISASLFFL